LEVKKLKKKMGKTDRDNRILTRSLSKKKKAPASEKKAKKNKKYINPNVAALGAI